MAWDDIAMITFVCTAANHMGLVDAVEGTIRHKLPIVNCCKCATFWTTLLYGFLTCHGDGVMAVMATSFLASMCAVWLELLMGFIDSLYDKAYGRIFDKTAVTTADKHEGSATAEDADNTKDTVPEMQLNESDFD